MKQQRIQNREAKTRPQFIDERSHTPPPELELDPAIANMPVRAVNFIEVGDMEAPRVSILLQGLNQQFSTAKGGVHYLIPIRHGKIPSDVIFEKEILDLVHMLCEVRDGQIVLKEAAHDVHVIRQVI